MALANLNLHCLDFWGISPFLSYEVGIEDLTRTQANPSHLGRQAPSVAEGYSVHHLGRQAPSVAEGYSVHHSQPLLWYSGWLMGM